MALADQLQSALKTETREVSLVYIGFFRLIFSIRSQESIGEEIKGIFAKFDDVVGVLFTKDDDGERYLNVYLANDTQNQEPNEDLGNKDDDL